MFNGLIINLVLVTFPIMLYFIYVTYSKTLDFKKNNLFLDCALISSYYLIYKLGYFEVNGIYFILIDILLVISYLKKRYITSLILSILLINYYYHMFNISIFIFIYEYIMYSFLYFIIKKRHLFINIFSVLKIVMFVIYLMLSNNSFNILNILFLLLTFILIINFIAYLFLLTSDVVSLYMDIKEIDKEKRLVDSLFKITHEIKNPIAVCKGYLDMFDINNTDHFKKYIPIIKSEINRVLTLLEDFLSISKIKIEKDEMDICYLIEDTINCFKPILKNKKIKIEANNIDDEIYIVADYNRLKQTLVNIIKNSVEAIKNDGLIKIDLKKNKNRISIIIEDNGDGMDSCEIDKIKEAFYTTKEKGTGLGIYLSNEIIKAHQGELNYSSIKNIGTKTIITLPYN
ncbi:MAG: HAMP domain-containing histidine kinase [Bacilli bacterium]|nr:HAMP domain-containing histidine kinase [Bacilli bacterium]